MSTIHSLQPAAAHGPGPVPMTLRRRLHARIPQSIRQGARYWLIKRAVARSERWPEARIEAVQLRLLRRVVSHAYASVPGYRRLCAEAGVSPSDLVRLPDIKAFPLMTKELLRDNLEDFTSRAVPRRHMRYEATSGSTGIPFGFYMTARNDRKEDAFIHEGWERAGWKLGERGAVLRGAFVGTREAFWYFDAKKNDLVLSSHYLEEDMYDAYAAVLERWRPRHLKAYPSAAAQFADLVTARGEAGRFRFATALLGSEAIYPWQREKIHRAFPGVRIYGWYGQTEQVILAGMCEGSDEYHIHPLYGYTEILDAQGRDVGAGDLGELVGTSFWSFATPLIRYRTLDLARRGPPHCRSCGRHSQLLLSLDGRTQEVVLSRTGRPVTLTTIASIHSRVFDNLQQFRFRQEARGTVEFRFRPKSTFTRADAESLRAEILARLGDGFEVHMKEVTELPRGSGGKFRFLEQALAPATAVVPPRAVGS